VLTVEHLSIKEWPKGMVPAGVLRSKEAAVERTVTVPLVAGEPILEGKLTSEGAPPGLASMIPPGMRAFTIQTPTVASGVAGFILPGNRVDVLLTTSFGGGAAGGGATTTLLQNVQVLAADQRLDANDKNEIDGGLKSVTLLVTPDQAAKLDLGMNRGTLHLALRNPEDHEEAFTRPATLAELRFHQERPNRDVSGLGKVMGALTSALTGASASPVDETADDSSQKPRRRYAHIQTIRGAHRGSIVVEKK
jgi:pilus assembly protein CpaB